MMKKALIIAMLVLALSAPALSSADVVKLDIQQVGKGVFVLTGRDVYGVQVLDVEVAYDAGALTNPVPLIDGGTLMEFNITRPGVLFISIYREIANSVIQITLNFDAPWDTGGRVHSASAVARKKTDRPIPPEFDIPSTSMGNEDASSDASDGGSAEAPPTASSVNEASGSIATGSGSHPVRSAAPKSDQRTESSSGSPGTAAPLSPSAQAPTEQAAVVMREENIESVLERFKTFRGEKSLGSFSALFGNKNSVRVKQEPAVAISDGRSMVFVRIEMPQDVAHPIGIALSDARLLSKESGDKKILITVLPREGTWDPRLVIISGQHMIDYPLVVAPPVALAEGLRADTFLEALQAYILNQPPALQREETRYISEYIFTANYLAGRERKARSINSQY
jgi:hypothetical protein